jgi:hypothetical protein
VRPVEKLCGKTRRRWIAEHWLRGLAWTLAWSLDACLVYLLLNRLFALPLHYTLAVLPPAAALALVVLARAWVRAPRGAKLAQLVDQRAGTGDLFASALEFHRDASRFGWLGELTCRQASARANGAVLAAEWSLGPARHWALAAAATVLLAGGYAASLGIDRLGPEAEGRRLAGQEVAAEPQPANEAPGKRKLPAEKTAAQEKPAAKLPADVEETPPEKPAAETVKITNEMIDRYLQQVPEEKVSLEGITPIRWDEDESSGKADPRNQRKEGEKVDPVKLDAALLKDLEAAKKTKEEGGKEGSAVDIAVMGKEGGDAAQGKSGGKEGKESLADAASKDPRGNPTRLAVAPARRGLSIASAARSPSNAKGQIRPMGLLEFLAAMRQAATSPAAPDRGAAPAAGRAPDEVISSETVLEADRDLIDGYFRRLREADR